MPDDRISVSEEVDGHFVKASERTDAIVEKLHNGEMVRECFNPFGLCAEFRKMRITEPFDGVAPPSPLIEVRLHVEDAPLHHLVKRSIRPLSAPVPCGALEIYKSDNDDAYYIRLEQLQQFIEGVESIANSAAVQAIHSSKASVIRR